MNNANREKYYIYFNHVDVGVIDIVRRYSTSSLHYAWHFDRQRQSRDGRRRANLLEMLIVPIVHGPAEFTRFSTTANSSPI